MVFEDLGPKALEGPTRSSDLTWYDRPSCVGPGIAFERRELPANAADGGGQLLLARRHMGYCPDFTIQLPGGHGTPDPGATQTWGTSLDIWLATLAARQAAPCAEEKDSKPFEPLIRAGPITRCTPPIVLRHRRHPRRLASTSRQ